ncbi:MAG: hypothetical protein VYE73_15525 [Acidobacteriota bacterium]|nr:hypothetical protein [Acidobacteriota bacterium]
MSFTAAIVIAAVVFVLAALIIAQQKRAQPERAAQPDATVDTSWDHYFAHPAEAPTRDQRAILEVGSSTGEARERLIGALREAGALALSAPEPLPVLRKAIMDATDRFITSETLYDEEASEGLASQDADAVIEQAFRVAFLGCASATRPTTTGTPTTFGWPT